MANGVCRIKQNFERRAIERVRVVDRNQDFTFCEHGLYEIKNRSPQRRETKRGIRAVVRN